MKNKRNIPFQSKDANVTGSNMALRGRYHSRLYGRISIPDLLLILGVIVSIVTDQAVIVHATQPGPGCAQPYTYQISIRVPNGTWSVLWDSTGSTMVPEMIKSMGSTFEFQIEPVDSTGEQWSGNDWYPSYEYCYLRDPAASWSGSPTSTATDGLLAVRATYTFASTGTYTFSGTHNGIRAYNGTCGNNCGGHCAIPGVTFNLTVYVFEIQYDECPLWWFNGENPGGGYHVQANLTAIPALGGTYDWQVTCGEDKVNLNNGGADSDHIVAQGDNTVVVKTTSFSQSWDVHVAVKYNDTLIGGYSTWILSPYSLTPKNPPAIDTSLCTWLSNGYASVIHYILKDYFGDTLPCNVPVMEQFNVGDPVTDYTGEDWGWGPEEGNPNGDPDDVTDHIQRAYVIGVGTPTPQGPQNPLGSVKIDHRFGKMRVGSMDKTKGVIVKDNIKWQIYRDHARHE
ncbi:MAG TPA: hypothetical protein PLG59_00070 [bacterium]|nr:hypothetical protein [bacterium]